MQTEQAIKHSRWTTFVRSRMWGHENGRGQKFWIGAIATPWGFVNAYRDGESYALAFIWHGVEYQLDARESISERAIVLRAKKFANGVVGRVAMALEGDCDEQHQ